MAASLPMGVARRHFLLSVVLQVHQRRDCSMARVLVLDRSALVRKCLETLLVESGHQAVVTGYGRTGFDHQTVRPADVIFAGRYLSDMTGVDFLCLLRGKDRATPAVMIRSTEAREEGSLLERSELGVVAMLEKPFNETDVHETIARAIGQVWVYGSDYVEPLHEQARGEPDELQQNGQSVA